MTSVNRGSFNRNSPTQTGQTQDRDFNPQVLRNLNKFYTDQNQKRKGLFERKKNYCDYDEFKNGNLETTLFLSWSLYVPEAAN